MSQLDGSFLSRVSVSSRLKALTTPRPVRTGPEELELINNLRPDLPVLLTVERLELVELSDNEGEERGKEGREGRADPIRMSLNNPEGHQGLLHCLVCPVSKLPPVLPHKLRGGGREKQGGFVSALYFALDVMKRFC